MNQAYKSLKFIELQCSVFDDFMTHMKIYEWLGRVKLGQGIATDDMSCGQPLTATYNEGKQPTDWHNRDNQRISSDKTASAMEVLWEWLNAQSKLCSSGAFRNVWTTNHSGTIFVKTCNGLNLIALTGKQILTGTNAIVWYRFNNVMALS